MKRIGLLSDTHGYIDDRIIQKFEDCDEIWHAGDIGNIAVADSLSGIKPFRAVFGNIDGAEIRSDYPAIQRFICEDVDVLMTHIGGYPQHYEPAIRKLIASNPPKLFISGHSHILKVIFDDKYKVLHINPGAAGVQGFHLIRTLVRFTLESGLIRDLEVVELGRRGAIEL
jgi:putative phosphoesterase